MRTGNFDTPARARSSPSVLSRAAPSSPCIMALIRSARASAWGIDLSLTSCVIIEAAAWVIEQQQAELVAAEAEGAGAVGRRRRERGSQRLEQHIAGVMTA